MQPTWARRLVATYGTLTLNSNGTYSYTLDNANPAVDALGDGDFALRKLLRTPFPTAI